MWDKAYDQENTRYVTMCYSDAAVPMHSFWWISDSEKSVSNLSDTHTKLCNKDLLVQFFFKIDYSGLPAHRIWIADLNIEVSCLFLINVVYFLCWDVVISTIHTRLHSELKPCNFH